MEQAEALKTYRKYVKDNPSEKEGARRSFYDTFGVDPETKPLFAKGEDPEKWTSFQAKQRLSHLNPSAPEGPGMIEKGLGKVVGTETAARMVGEAPAAAGMAALSLVPGGALAKGAAFASTKGLVEGATGKAKSPRQVAKDFVWDTVLVAAVDKTITTAAKVGGPLWDKFVLNAAAKTEAGARTLSQAEDSAHQAVQESVGSGRIVDVSGPYRKFVNFIDSLPHGRGAVEGQYGKIHGAAKDLYEAVSADLGQVEGATGLPKPATQPLDALIRFESKWMQSAWGAASGATSKSEQSAVNAMKDFADEVRGVITKSLTPAERQMFEYAKGLTSARMEATISHDIARNAVTGLIRGTLRDVYGIVGEPLVKKFTPVMLEQMLGSGPRLSLLKGLTSRVSNNPAALNDAITQGTRTLLPLIPVQIKDAIQREAKAAADKAKALIPRAQEVPNAAPDRQVQGSPNP